MWRGLNVVVVAVAMLSIRTMTNQQQAPNYADSTNFPRGEWGKLYQIFPTGESCLSVDKLSPIWRFQFGVLLIKRPQFDGLLKHNFRQVFGRVFATELYRTRLNHDAA
jgi:hypothetical protein